MFFLTWEYEHATGKTGNAQGSVLLLLLHLPLVTHLQGYRCQTTASRPAGTGCCLYPDGKYNPFRFLIGLDQTFKQLFYSSSLNELVIFSSLQKRPDKQILCSLHSRVCSLRSLAPVWCHAANLLPKSQGALQPEPSPTVPEQGRPADSSQILPRI